MFVVKYLSPQPSYFIKRANIEKFGTNLYMLFNVMKLELGKTSEFSGVASGGTRSGAQALGVYQHAFCSHLKPCFKQKFRPKYA